MVGPRWIIRRANAAGSAFVLRAKCLLLWALALAAACQAQSPSEPTPAGGGGETSNSVIAAGLLGVVLVPVLLYWVRRRMEAHISLRMNENLAAKEDGDAEEPGAREVDAQAQLQLAFHDADEPTGSGFESRIRGERRLFRLTCLADLGTGIGYIGLPWLFKELADESGGESDSWIVGGLLMAFFAVMRYGLFRGQFKAFDLSLSRSRQRAYRWLGRIAYGIAALFGAGNVAYVPDVLRAIFELRTLFSSVLFGVMATTAVSMIWEGEENVTGLGLLAAVCLHACVFALLLRGMRLVAGPRLLILRVFGIEATSSFVFSGLMRYWRHFGNHLTIVDASMVRQHHRNRENRTLLMVFGLYLVLLLVSWYLVNRVEAWMGHSLHWFWLCAVVTTLTVVPAWAALTIGKRRLDRLFISTPEQLLARLRRMELVPRERDLSFRHVSAMCHDHTWFRAVREFAMRADVVLMDLRGYSDQRRGCQKEVDFLFDAVPVDRLLFLVDMGNDESVVSGMLMARWEQLNQTSPNLGLSSPVIHLYRVLDNDERDMQAILNRLIDTADAAVADPDVSEPSRA